MKYLVVFALLLAAAGSTQAQVSSHSSTSAANPASSSPFQVSDKPVARVNGAILTDRDLLREMLQIFPYASQHQGFPKAQEASIREGALQMIIFEELVYQEARRRGLKIPPQQLQREEIDFKKQFHSQQEYQQFLNTEMGARKRTYATRSLAPCSLKKFSKLTWKGSLP